MRCELKFAALTTAVFWSLWDGRGVWLIDGTIGAERRTRPNSPYTAMK
jgi:hypothetical protein